MVGELHLIGRTVVESRMMPTSL